MTKTNLAVYLYSMMAAITPKQLATMVSTISLSFLFLQGCGHVERSVDHAHATPASIKTVPEIGNSFRSRESEITVDLPLKGVWDDWTTKNGQEAFFGGVVSIDLQTNGHYDVWFLPEAPEGQRGHEDGRIVAVEPPHLLSFTWTMPPYMPRIRPHHTFVQIHFTPLSATKTSVKLSHTGFGRGTHWDQGYAYFTKTWPAVLKNYLESK